MMIKLFHRLLSLLFPLRCPFCGGVMPVGAAVSPVCADSLPFIIGEICPRCGREVAFCCCDGRSVAFDRCVAPFYYEGAVRRGIINCKFHARQSSAFAFAGYAATAVQKAYQGEQFDFVAFVPLTRTEYRKRGFNQSELFARALARALSLPCRSALQKPRDVAPQRSLPASGRWVNVSGAFFAPSRLDGRRVLLVDDIVTTGATLSDCARALKAAGADRVCCAVIASVRERRRS
jgi:competence protein ComFC